MTDINLYGLKNCDTCRKAKRGLEEAGHNVSFQDVRAEPIPCKILKIWLEKLGDSLLNQRSTTWRGLSEAERGKPPLDLLTEHPALMKRPVIEADGTLYLGWSKETQAALSPNHL